MPSTRRVSTAVRVNESHYCDVRGCTKHRSSLSRYCSTHAAAHDRNGHPVAAPVRASSWAAYRSAITELFHDNADHQGLQRALQWVKSWMAEAVALDGRNHCAAEVARVSRHGCSPLQILTELAAAYAYVVDNPRVTLTDRHRDFTYSKAVLGLAPRPRRASQTSSSTWAPKAHPRALEEVGPQMVRVLGRFLHHTHEALRSNDERAKAELAALDAQFRPTNLAVERAAAEALNLTKATT